MSPAMPRGASAQYAPRPSLDLGALIPASALSEPLRAELAIAATDSTVIPILDTAPISPLDSTVASHESIPPTNFPITEKASWSLALPLEQAIHRPFAAELAMIEPSKTSPVEITKNINQGVTIERSEIRSPAPQQERRIERERPTEPKVYAQRLPEVRQQFSPTVSGQAGQSAQQNNSRPRPLPQQGVPLSSLKVNAKRDKGPSTENLSTLKQALQAAMATRSTPEQSEGSETKQVTQNDTRVSPPTTQNASSFTPPLARPKVEDMRPFAKPDAASSLPESRNVPQQKVSLLEPTPATPVPKEIPLDVLRGVLSE